MVRKGGLTATVGVGAAAQVVSTPLAGSPPAAGLATHRTLHITHKTLNTRTLPDTEHMW